MARFDSRWCSTHQDHAGLPASKYANKYGIWNVAQEMSTQHKVRVEGFPRLPHAPKQSHAWGKPCTRRSRNCVLVARGESLARQCLWGACVGGPGNHSTSSQVLARLAPAVELMMPVDVTAYMRFVYDLGLVQPGRRLSTMELAWMAVANFLKWPPAVDELRKHLPDDLESTTADGMAESVRQVIRFCDGQPFAEMHEQISKTGHAHSTTGLVWFGKKLGCPRARLQLLLPPPPLLQMLPPLLLLLTACRYCPGCRCCSCYRRCCCC